jgi:hypothetical protein
MYNHIISDLFGEFKEKPDARRAPVPYEIYQVIMTSRFPEKIYPHFISECIQPSAIAESLLSCRIPIPYYIAL